MVLDPRWKLPQGKSPEQIHDALYQVVRELRKGDYLANAVSGSIDWDDFGTATTGYHLSATGVGNPPVWAGFLQTGTGAATRTWQDKARDLVSVTDWGAIGDGSDDTTAVTNADADPRAKFSPPGLIFDTTLAASALDGPYHGHGQIRDTANNLRGPWFSAVKAPPASFGNHDSVSTAFNGDLSKVQIAMEHRVTGTTTLGQPTTGYQADPEASPIYLNLFNSSGHNQGTADNDGRTASRGFWINLTNAGQGDCVGMHVTGVASGTRSGSTSFLANPAVTVIDSALFAGSDGVLLNTGEMQVHDEGFDIAGLGWNIVLDRNNSTGAKDAFWAGFRVHSDGTQPPDLAFTAVGPFKYGLDLTGGTFTDNAAIALEVNQRIYGNAVADATGALGAPSSHGTEWIDYDASQGWRFAVGDTPVIRLIAGKILKGHTGSLAYESAGTEAAYQQNGTDAPTAAMSVARWSNGSTAGTFVFDKSRGASIGTHTVVQADDGLGNIRWFGSDGTAFINAAMIQALVDGTPGTNDMPGRLAFYTTADGSASLTERMRIDQAGVVHFQTDRGARFNNQTSGAGASTGTLTNAPAAGNPGHWLKINIGGTNYAIPCWLG